MVIIAKIVKIYKKFKENIENRNIKIQKYKELYKHINLNYIR